MLSFLTIVLGTTLLAQAQQRGVIYSEDSRVDLYEVMDLEILSLARAVAGIVPTNNIVDLGRGKAQLKSRKIKDDLLLCSDEKFVNQESAVFCTAFLVSPTVVVTAGHCIESQMACENSRFVFDYGIRQPQDNYTVIPMTEIYGCKKLIFSNDPAKEGQGIDIAVVQLDREVTNRKPLKIRNYSPNSSGQTLFMLGHPLGLPLKYTDGAQIIRIENQEYFRCDLDAYMGNSGSPVFAADTREVIGVLVSGEEDFPKVPEGQCRRSKVCQSADDCVGELVLNSAQWLPFLPSSGYF